MRNLISKVTVTLVVFVLMSCNKEENSSAPEYPIQFRYNSTIITSKLAGVMISDTEYQDLEEKDFKAGTRKLFSDTANVFKFLEELFQDDFVVDEIHLLSEDSLRIIHDRNGMLLDTVIAFEVRGRDLYSDGELLGFYIDEENLDYCGVYSFYLGDNPNGQNLGGQFIDMCDPNDDIRMLMDTLISKYRIDQGDTIGTAIFDFVYDKL